MNSNLVFGGILLKNSHAKTPRTLDSRKAVHLALRANSLSNPHGLLRLSSRIQKLIFHQAKKQNLKVYRCSLEQNAIQILLRFHRRSSFQRFIRAITGLIARLALNAERARPKLTKLKFWMQRPFSRIVSWGPDLEGVKRFLNLSLKKTLGFDLSFSDGAYLRFLPELTRRLIKEAWKTHVFIERTK